MGGNGQGYIFLLDQTYRTIATIKAGNHEFADFHEFEITENNTALITIYTRELEDLTAFGVSGEAWITNCKFQEIEISTGKVCLGDSSTEFDCQMLMGGPFRMEGLSARQFE